MNTKTNFTFLQYQNARTINRNLLEERFGFVPATLSKEKDGPYLSTVQRNQQSC